MSVTRQELFRPESLAARQDQWLGRHTLALGAPTTISGFVSLLLVASSLAIVALGSYARRVELHGIVLPSAGLIQVASPVVGRVQALKVEDGTVVAADAPLYTVNLDTATADGNTQQQIQNALARQRSMLMEQIARKVRLRSEYDAVIQQRINNLRDQVQETAAHISMKDGFVQTLTKALIDYNRYVQTGVGNMNERNAQQANWMRARDELEDMRSSALRLQAQLIDAQFQQSTTNLQVDSDISELQAKISVLDQQIADSEARRSIEVRAPGAGKVTAITVFPGQMVASGARMLTIVPVKSKMEVELLAPSSSISFIRPGQRVKLRYSAFPYQKFGHYFGTVTEVSRAGLQPDELKTLVPVLSAADQSKTFYRVVVTPDLQDVTAYGRPEPLEASMQADASVMLDSRPLYQWILEPLYSLRGANS